MKHFINKAKKIILDNRPKIKIQLDYKTTLIVRSMNAFNMWKLRFPEARIINE